MTSRSVRLGASALGSVLCVLCACGATPRDDDDTTPEPVLPAASTGTSAGRAAPVEGPPAGDGVGLSRWIQERLAVARAGRRERVRIPVVFRSSEWGCSCPGTFLGDDPDGHNGGDTWLSLSWARGLTAPEPTEEGSVLVVEGRFTGARVEEDLRSGPDDPSDYVYTESVFEVERIVGPAGDDVPAAVLLGTE